jgi:ceramide glucosyltransferase
MFSFWSYLILPFCLGSIIYYLLSIYVSKDFFNPENKEISKSNFTPAISILKPLCGIPANAYENLASFLCQNYPQYQVIFCVRDRDDPVIKLIEKLIKDFPDADISLVINPRLIGHNLKVSNLANGLELAKYEIIVMADSDIQVEKNYLQQIIKPLENEKVGVVTCLYNSVGQGWIANLDGIGIACDFVPSVLIAKKLEGIKFAFGATIVIRKKVLEAIGNFKAIADNLADDFLLGNLATKLGYQVVLSNYIVKHHIGKESWQDFCRRQIRWLRCIKGERFWSYLGIIFTQGTVTSLLFLIASHGSLIGILVCLTTLMLRLLMAYLIGFKKLKDPVAQNFLGLVFVSDLLRFILWVWALFGNTVQWRGKKFQLVNGTKLSQI